MPFHISTGERVSICARCHVSGGKFPVPFSSNEGEFIQKRLVQTHVLVVLYLKVRLTAGKEATSLRENFTKAIRGFRLIEIGADDAVLFPGSRV